MILKAPINSSDDLQALLPYSVSQVYLGLDLEGSASGELNRQNCGVNSLDELSRITRLAHQHNIKVQVTLNNYYNEYQLEKIKKIFISLSEADGIIAADLSLLEWMKKQNFTIPVTASVLLSVMNSWAANYLFETYGIQNYVLASHLSVAEIVSICNRNPHLHFEVLALNYGCFYEDGFCSFLHSQKNTSKTVSFLLKIARGHKNLFHLFLRYAPQFIISFFYQHILKIPPCSFSDKNIKILKGSRFNIKIKQIANERHSKIFMDKCGICAFYDFYHCGLHGIKIAGRDLPLTKKQKDVQMIQEAIALAKEAKDKKTYISMAIPLFSKYKGFPCNKKFCYYQGIFDE